MMLRNAGYVLLALVLLGCGTPKTVQDTTDVPAQEQGSDDLTVLEQDLQELEQEDFNEEDFSSLDQDLSEI